MRELPVGWAHAPLDAVADVLDFEREPVNSSERERRIGGKPQRELYSYYGATGRVGFIDSYRSEGERVLLGEDAAPFLDPTKDKAYFATGRFWVNNHAHVLFGACGLVENKFLCHQLNIVDYRPFVTGSTRLKLTSAAMRQIRLALAPAAEQTRIVAKLEELLSDLDAGVAELKAAQKKLQQYRQSLLKAAVDGTLTSAWREAQRVNGAPVETGEQLLARILRERRARWEEKQLAKFKEQGKPAPRDWQKKYPEPVAPDTTDLPGLPEGWAWASIAQVASDEKYSLAIGPFGSNLKVSDYRDSGVPLVFIRNIRSGQYGSAYTTYVTAQKAEELVAHSIVVGDVLVTKMGEPPGDADVYPAGQPPAIITADCIKIRCMRDMMHPAYLKAAINSHVGRLQIGPMTQGVAQKKVSLGRFSVLAIPLPPADEQAAILRILGEAFSNADEQLAAIDVVLRQSAAQRQNILRAAFSGQLVPQDPNDEPASVLLERIRSERAAQVRQSKPRSRKAGKAARVGKST